MNNENEKIRHDARTKMPVYAVMFLIGGVECFNLGQTIGGILLCILSGMAGSIFSKELGYTRRHEKPSDNAIRSEKWMMRITVIGFFASLVFIFFWYYM